MSSVIGKVTEFIEKNKKTTIKEITEGTGLKNAQIHSALHTLRKRKRVKSVGDKVIWQEAKANHKEQIKPKSTISDSDVFQMMDDDDKSQYLKMEQQIIFLTKSKDALIDSYKSILSRSRS